MHFIEQLYLFLYLFCCSIYLAVQMQLEICYLFHFRHIFYFAICVMLKLFI